jgi:hypothetical protein
VATIVPSSNPALIAAPKPLRGQRARSDPTAAGLASCTRTA